MILPFFQLEIGNQTSPSRFCFFDTEFSLPSSANNNLTFTINNESDFILNNNEFIR